MDIGGEADREGVDEMVLRGGLPPGGALRLIGFSGERLLEPMRAEGAEGDAEEAHDRGDEEVGAVHARYFALGRSDVLPDQGGTRASRRYATRPITYPIVARCQGRSPLASPRYTGRTL